MDFKWLTEPVTELLGIVREAVPDKDLQTKMVGKLNELQSNIYLAELQTKTHPVIDGIHKLGRQFLALYTASLSAWLIHSNPEIDLLSLGALAGPTGIYTYMKGRGK